MNYTCIAIDDEPLFLKMLQVLIAEIPELELLSTYTNPIDGVMAAVKLKPDLMFVDYEMPYLDGFESLEIMDQLPRIIMISGFLRAHDVTESKLDIAGFISKQDLRSSEVLKQKVMEVMS